MQEKGIPIIRENSLFKRGCHYTLKALRCSKLIVSEMKLFSLIILLILLVTTRAQAFGASDYELGIGGGYFVYCHNGFDIGIRNTRSLVLSPLDYESVGPLVAFQMRENYVLTKNVGSSLRLRFEGDTYKNVDRSREWFFIIDKETDEPLGPFTMVQFEGKLLDLGVSQGEWVIAKDPDIGGSTIAAVLICIVILSVVTLPILGTLWVVQKLRRSRGQNVSGD